LEKIFASTALVKDLYSEYLKIAKNLVIRKILKSNQILAKDLKRHVIEKEI
jgi:hypothetical protein